MSRPLATGIDPLSVAARCPEVKRLVGAVYQVVGNLEAAGANWTAWHSANALQRLRAALAPFEGKPQATESIGEDLDD